MFHANGWGTVFAAPMVGAKLVLPGPWLDGESVYGLMTDFSVNFSVGVPTVWLNLLSHMETNALPRPPALKSVCIGGSAAPRSMIDTFEVSKVGHDLASKHEIMHLLFWCYLLFLPPSYSQIKYGINVFHLWGMTELSPVGTVSGVKAALTGRSQDHILATKTKQGR